MADDTGCLVGKRSDFRVSPLIEALPLVKVTGTRKLWEDIKHKQNQEEKSDNQDHTRAEVRVASGVLRREL